MAQYQKDDGSHKFIRKLLALPFLPVKEIKSQFKTLYKTAEEGTIPQMMELVEYIKAQWIKNPLFKPRSWCVYSQPIRTNNDVEGWHNAINRRASGKSDLPLYMLIELLHQEAFLVSIVKKLVSDNKLSRGQRRKYRVLQGRIFAEWEKYEKRERTGRELLRAISKINGPRHD